ncbi:MAG: hypothetical protein ABIM19_08015 [candidate division WOR-3 bacterium]
MADRTKKVWIFHTPSGKIRTIWEDREWGFPDGQHNRSKWKQIKEGEEALLVQKKDAGYQIVGEGIIERTEEVISPNPKWNERGSKTEYPLRVYFAEVKRADPPYSLEEIWSDSSGPPERFSIIDAWVRERAELPPQVSSLALLSARITVAALEGKIPPAPLKELLSIFYPQDPKAFEDAVVSVLRLLGFKVIQRGYKESGEETYDFEIQGEDVPIIGDAKFSDNYRPDANERRKIMDYIRRYAGGKKRLKFVIVVKETADVNTLREEASKEGIILSWLSYGEHLLPLLKVVIDEGAEKAREGFIKYLD